MEQANSNIYVNEKDNLDYENPFTITSVNGNRNISLIEVRAKESSRQESNLDLAISMLREYLKEVDGFCSMCYLVKGDLLTHNENECFLPNGIYCRDCWKKPHTQEKCANVKPDLPEGTCFACWLPVGYSTRPLHIKITDDDGQLDVNFGKKCNSGGKGKISEVILYWYHCGSEFIPFRDLPLVEWIEKMIMELKHIAVIVSRFENRKSIGFRKVQDPDRNKPPLLKNHSRTLCEVVNG